MKNLTVKIQASPWARQLIVFTMMDECLAFDEMHYEQVKLDKRYDEITFSCADENGFYELLKQFNMEAMKLRNHESIGVLAAKNKLIKSWLEDAMGDVKDFIKNKNGKKKVVKKKVVKGPTCPHCDSDQLTKNGKSKSGKQKFKCKSCKRTHTSK